MDETELIANFIGLTGCSDTDIAIKYLIASNWSLPEAYSAYEDSKSSPKPPLPDIIDNDIPQEPSITQYVKGALNWAFSPIRSIFTPKAQPAPAPDSFSAYLQRLAAPSYPRQSSNTLTTLSESSSQSSKPVLIYIHQSDYGDVFVRTVLCNSEIVSILNSSFIFFGILGESNEGREAVAMFSDEVYATFVILNGNQILDRLEYPPSIDELMEFLLKYTNNTEEPFVDDRFIRKNQDKELKEAEQAMLAKNEEERRMRQRVLEENKEKELQARREEQKREEKERLIGKEPDMAEGVTQITFKLPGGEKIERRFVAESRVEMLYLFLQTKGIGECELLSGYPPTVMGEGTLSDAGLVPRGLIHVRVHI